MSKPNKRSAQTPVYYRIGGKAPRCQLGHAAGGAASPASAASAAAAAVPKTSNDMAHDLLREVVEKAQLALRKWTLSHGTLDHVCKAIDDFFRTEAGKDHSFAYMEKDDDDIITEMKNAVKALNVPDARWFWTNNDLDDDCSDEEPDIQDFWDEADDLQVSVARLAWLMENDEEE